MGRFVLAVCGIVLGYVVGGLGGAWLWYLLTPNRHDPSLEAAMTGAFFIGPAAAMIGLVAMLWLTRRRNAGP